VAVWDELRVALSELVDTGALASYPDPRHDRDDFPPYRIGLAGWATGVAADLHHHFGSDVELQVGALSYPDPKPVAVFSRPAPPTLDRTEVRIELDGPGVVRSGDVLRTGLRVQNLGASVLEIHTNGTLTALFLDPNTGDVAGSYSGAQSLPLKVYRIAPGDTKTIPLLVGTDSFVPELGYTVPAGDWPIVADFKLGGGEVLRSPSVNLTVTKR